MTFASSVRLVLAIVLCSLSAVESTRGAGEEIAKATFSFAATGVHVAGQAVLLAIDDVSLP
ncbi:MAG: hypothetical protein ACC628_22225, partial [Pirellulaceae bacterium]